MALSLFFGDEFGAFASFGIDAVAAVPFAGLLAARHHCRPVDRRRNHVRRDIQLTRGMAQRAKHAGAVGFGGVDVPGRGSQDDAAVGQLLIGPMPV